MQSERNRNGSLVSCSVGIVILAFCLLWALIMGPQTVSSFAVFAGLILVLAGVLGA